MPVQISGPILDSSGRPANGYLRVRASRPFDTGDGHVTEALGVATVIGGEPRVAGGQWAVPVTPDGVSLALVQDLDGDQMQRFDVVVPDRASMTYSELLFNRGGAGEGGANPYWWDLTGGANFPAGALIGDYGFDSETGDVWRYEA